MEQVSESPPILHAQKDVPVTFACQFGRQTTSLSLREPDFILGDNIVDGQAYKQRAKEARLAVLDELVAEGQRLKLGY